MMNVVYGFIAYCALVAVSYLIEILWSRRRRITAYAQLWMFCLIAILFENLSGFLLWAENRYIHLAIIGFLITGCVLSTVRAFRDKARSGGDAEADRLASS